MWWWRGEAALGFVGGGRGSYIQETSYQYVGAGCGELEYVTPAPKSNFVCIFIGGGLLLLLIPLLLWLLFGGSFTATTTPGAYDCNAGFSNWQMGWSAGKKLYCCSNYNKGCAPAPVPVPPRPNPTYPPTAPPTTSHVYDCAAGYSNWQNGWSASKKVYCCLHSQKGCPTAAPLPPAPPAPAPLPVPVPVPVPVPAPAPAPLPVTTSSCPYDCTAGYDEWPMQWVKGWGGAKKIYCCQTASKGCDSELPKASGLPPSGIPAAPDKGPYDCQAGYHPCFICLVKHWSANKLSWCCTEKNLGCKSNTPAHM